PAGNVALDLDYQPSLMYEFGATRQLGKGYFASVGYFYSENSSPNAEFNPLVPDTNLKLGSVGVGYHGKTWDWALAYDLAYNHDRVVSGSNGGTAGGPTGGVDGKYETFNQAVTAAVTYKF